MQLYRLALIFATLNASAMTISISKLRRSKLREQKHVKELDTPPKLGRLRETAGQTQLQPALSNEIKLEESGLPCYKLRCEILIKAKPTDSYTHNAGKRPSIVAVIRDSIDVPLTSPIETCKRASMRLIEESTKLLIR